jgi:chemotaxis methyl-accepting protein methylase
VERPLEQILDHLRRTSGVDLGGYRVGPLRKRLAARMEQVGVTEADAYLALVRSDPGECEQLLGALAVNVTSFFRDPIVFEILAQRVVRGMVERASRRKTGEIRVWCAGCATGEEAYSVAILIHRALTNEPGRWQPLVFGTDINEESLTVARRGIYSRERLESTQLGIVDRYFAARGDQYEVLPDLREIVRFSRDDLTASDRLCPAESIFGAFDLVLCRNLLIYFSPDLQQAVLDKLCHCIRPGGTLVLGSAEFLGGAAAGRFRPVDARNRIFQKT